MLEKNSRWFGKILGVTINSRKFKMSGKIKKVRKRQKKILDCSEIIRIPEKNYRLSRTKSECQKKIIGYWKKF